ncbi:ABC transporter substrate-binding protein [Magnetovibrio sp. PR-2]|uniref:ABC transporter substrate-binding protein n=1 Tax=Magnetovibrio sp. PR-2 TaxID=3120356 RepID=UPI002FCE1DD3
MKHLLVAAFTTAATLVGTGASAQYYGQPSYGYGQGNMPPQNQQRYAPRNPRYAPGCCVKRQAPQVAPQVAPRTYAPRAPQVDFKGAPDPAVNVKHNIEAFRSFVAKAQQTGIDRTTAIGIIADQIATDIDFNTMTKMALGRLSMRMSPQQKSSAREALQTNFTTKLVELAGDNMNTQFQVGKTRIGTSKGERVVPLMVKRGQGEPITVNLRYYHTNGKWKVFDAEASGQSVVMFYRGYFARQFRVR